MNKSIEVLKTQYTNALATMTSSYGMLAGLADYYCGERDAAIEALKTHGCDHCNHLRCTGCENLSNWSIAHEAETET